MKIRNRSGRDPFAYGRPAVRLADTLRVADAMGLVELKEPGDAVNLEGFRTLARGIADARIALRPLREIEEEIERPEGGDAERLARLLGTLETALEESPVPAREWSALERLLGTELLARLVDVSASSLRRYRTGARATPDDVAARLHFLALVVGDLSGAYNEIGVRRWFERSRTALSDRRPADLLAGGWSPEDPDPAAVRALARSLVSSPAT
jgi:uncharacterized protein (DUF2384 family)